MKTASTSLRRSRTTSLRTTSPGAVIALVLALGLAAATTLGAVMLFAPRAPSADITGSINFCPARAGNYSPLNLDRCVNACISCDHGTVVTCATSCRLKGAL